MPPTIKQKTREKRARQSDVMSDIENMDVMLGKFPGSDFQRQEIAGKIDGDLESDRLQTVGETVEQEKTSGYF